MKQTSRTIAFLLALLTLVSLMTACAKDKPAGSETTAAPNAESSVPAETESEQAKNDPKLSSVNWQGKEFTILYNGNDLEPNLDFIATEMNGDVLNDAVYQRNQAIEDKHGIKIVTEYKKDADIMTAVHNTNMTNDCPYFLIEANQSYSMSMALTGELTEFSDLDAINLDKPYWNSNLLAGSSIGGKNFFAYSDANVHAFGATPCAIFNKQVHKDFNLPDVYQLVSEKKWTHAAMSEMVKVVTGDLDGDGKITKDDRLGMIANNFCVDCFISGSGYNMITKDSDDLPVLNITDEKFYNIINSIKSLCSVENGMFLVDRTSTATEAREYWTEWAITDNRALFWIGNFKCVQRLRSMETDFGVVPIPMVDEDQGGYAIHMQANIGAAMSVPSTVKSKDDVAVLLEDIAYQSYLTVMPDYIDVLIQGQLVRDVDSLISIQTIRDSYYCDMGFMLGNYGISILGQMRTVVTNNTDQTPLLKAVSNTYKKIIDEIRTGR